MEFYKKCKAHIPDPRYMDDILHPCVRYVEEGFCGYKWWMVQTPLYGGDDKMENPILFRAVESEDGRPPVDWEFVEVVRETPRSGYNSDPNLFFHEGLMYVLWREFRTPEIITKGFNTGIFLVSYDEAMQKSEPVLLFGECSKTELTDLSPILSFDNGEFRIRTIHFKQNIGLLWFFYKVIEIILKPFGHTARWNHSVGMNILSSTEHDKGYNNGSSLKFNNIHKPMCKPWHFDVVRYRGRDIFMIYDIVSDKIYLGIESNKGEISISSASLLSNIQCFSGFYKPTGVVLGDHLYLYTTCHSNPEDLKRNEMWLSEIYLPDALNNKLQI